MTQMLIDRYLPEFDVTKIEHRVVDADIDTTWEALCELDLLRVHSPLMNAAVFVRGLPSEVAGWLGREHQVEEPGPLPELKLSGDGAFQVPGWLPLGETEGEEIAFGAIGRFWQPDIDWYDVTDMGPEEFSAFDEPGWGRIAANFSLRPYGEPRTLVSYEARTATSDAEAARKFSRYWSPVRPFVGHIMRAALDTLRRDAERRAAVQPIDA